MTITKEFVNQVRRKLNITWNEENTDNRVNDIINMAIPDLIDKLGIADPDFDFSVPGKENKLFLAYCLYEWNHCANEFDDNYHNDIAQIQQKNDVAYYQQREEAKSEYAEAEHIESEYAEVEEEIEEAESEYTESEEEESEYVESEDAESEEAEVQYLQ